MRKKNKTIYVTSTLLILSPCTFKLGLRKLGDEMLEKWHHFEKLIEKFWKNEPSFPNQHQKSLFSLVMAISRKFYRVGSSKAKINLL